MLNTTLPLFNMLAFAYSFLMLVGVVQFALDVVKPS